MILFVQNANILTQSHQITFVKIVINILSNLTVNALQKQVVCMLFNIYQEVKNVLHAEVSWIMSTSPNIMHVIVRKDMSRQQVWYAKESVFQYVEMGFWFNHKNNAMTWTLSTTTDVTATVKLRRISIAQNYHLHTVNFTKILTNSNSYTSRGYWVNTKVSCTFWLNQSKYHWACSTGQGFYHLTSPKVQSPNPTSNTNTFLSEGSCS